MTREVEVYRIVNVVQKADDPATPAPDTRDSCDSGEPARQQIVLRAAASDERDDWLPARRASPLIEVERVTLPDTPDPRLVLLREPGSEGARSYRLLRHRLLSHGDPRVVVVTSACAGEGKTTCAANLALAMAEDTMTRVLLLDAHLRRPALGRVLGFVPPESLVENMARFAHVGPPYPVVSIPGTRLDVAALPDTPIEDGRLDRTLFAVALTDLRDAYDYIVIDAAAVLESGDVDVVGECSNGVIMTARAGLSRKGDMRRAVAQLAPTPVLGSVLVDA